MIDLLSLQPFSKQHGRSVRGYLVTVRADSRLGQAVPSLILAAISLGGGERLQSGNRIGHRSRADD
jgi:hypothetical protein